MNLLPNSISFQVGYAGDFLLGMARFLFDIRAFHKKGFAPT